MSKPAASRRGAAVPFRKRAAPAARQLPAMRRALLAWFVEHQRDLPWRRDRTAYRVWICEIMAQQTRIETLVPYFERFVERFPDVRSLAGAPLDDVLALWSGLGYYSRARHLHAAARQVAEQYNGVMPVRADDLIRLPGVGRYTAHAIASIAGGEAAAVLDGNVMRVLTRLFDLDGDIASAAMRGSLWALAAELLDRRSPGAWNEAMMELGATVCTPRQPDCGDCPLRKWCAALASETVEERPVKSAARAPKLVRMTAGLIRRQDQVLLIRNQPGGLFGGLWTPPFELIEITRRGGNGAAMLVHPLFRREGLGELMGKFEHVLTHRRMQVEVRAMTPPDQDSGSPDDRRWVRPSSDLNSIGVSTLTRKILRVLDIHSHAEGEQPDLFAD
ncbi:MAG: Endonuclease III [Myxococcota bacterium]|nr:Endonuclease III [Myxococcota bacterium]